METQLVREHPAEQVYTSTRARIVALLGPLTVVGGIIWAIVQPYRLTLLHPYHQGFWWLVDRSRRCSSSSRASRSRSSSRGRSSPSWRETMEPPSEMVHWLFGMCLLLLGLIMLAEVIVGPEVWRRRAWRIYLWPGHRLRARGR